MLDEGEAVVVGMRCITNYASIKHSSHLGVVEDACIREPTLAFSCCRSVVPDLGQHMHFH